MLNLSILDTYLSKEFNFDGFKNIDTINGVQVSRDTSPIQKIACAVDASLESISTAAEQDADVLLVHHGFFWGSPLTIQDTMYKKVKTLLDANMALYAIHLPLDAHMKLGNNVQIAQRLGLEQVESFGNYRGLSIGTQGRYAESVHIDEVYERLFKDDAYHVPGRKDIPIVQIPALAQAPYNNAYRPIGCHTARKEQVSKVAIISGGGTKDIGQAYDEGADLYITGDASHTAWLQARELDMHVCFAGHYFSEVWGVMALGAWLQSQYDIEVSFINSPTGL